MHSTITVHAHSASTVHARSTIHYYGIYSGLGHIFWIVYLVAFVSVFRFWVFNWVCVCVFRIVCLLAFMNVFVYCLLIYVIFVCVNAGIFILNMIDHKSSAYHDISSTHVERTALKLFSYFIQSIFIIHCQSFIYLKILRLCEWGVVMIY